jgi:hypothetical protein
MVYFSSTDNCQATMQIMLNESTFFRLGHGSCIEEMEKKGAVDRKLEKGRVSPYLFKFLADECECLKNGICWSCDCDNAFRA